MIFEETLLEGSYIISPKVLEDSRGWFTRFFCKKEFAQIGHTKEWVQINHSFTSKKGSVRGMHFQKPPFEEIKMVRCIAGAVYDVIVDIRKDSKTFLNYFGAELSAENKKMMYIPQGFAHGFQTLSDDAELIYHHTQYYNPEAEDALHHQDSILNITWPLIITEVSERDANHKFLTQQFKGI